MSGGAKWMKKNPELAGLLAVAGTVATAGAAAPAIGAGVAGTAAATEGLLGTAGAASSALPAFGAVSPLATEAGLAGSLLPQTAPLSTPMFTEAIAAGAEGAPMQMQSLLGISPSAAPKGLSKKAGEMMLRGGMNMMQDEEQQPIASPQQTNLPPQDIPSFAQLSGRGMPGTGTSVPQAGMGEMDEEQRKWLMMLKQMGVA
jgi:hypothetical protein